MNVMELGVLFVRYSELRKDLKVMFLHEHPELKNEVVIQWALKAAQIRNMVGEKTEAGLKLFAALELSLEIENYALAQQAVSLITEILLDPEIDDKRWIDIAVSLQHVSKAENGSYNKSVVKIIDYTVHRIEANACEFSRCWEILMNTAETLKFLRKNAVGGLLDSLLSKNPKIVMLSMLYLGILRVEGVDTTAAIEPIRCIKNQSSVSSPNFQIAIGSLAMLGDSVAQEVRNTYMMMSGKQDVQEFNLECIGITLSELIA